MRSLISLSLVFLPAILSGLAQASALGARSCDPGSELCSRTYPQFFKRQATPTVPEGFTNAQRLARGLPLKPPNLRRGPVAPRTPQTSAVPQTTYTGAIEVFSGSTALGYLGVDANGYTAELTNFARALHVSFQLPHGATSGSQLSFTQSDSRGSYFAPVVGSGSTSSDMAVGSANYLYLDPVSASTAAGATPQSVPSYFSTQSGTNAQTETAVWSVDTVTQALTAQWINTDSSTPSTVFFVQNTHLYAGGDATAYHTKYPSTVTPVTLRYVGISTSS